jgi:hypothetical protein
MEMTNNLEQFMQALKGSAEKLNNTITDIKAKEAELDEVKKHMIYQN